MVIVRLSVLVGFVLLVASVCGLPTVAKSAVKIKKLEETPGAIQGDMFYPPTTQRGVAVRGVGIRWTNGIVPYEILPGFEPASQQAIIGAMRRLERAVAVNNIQCVQFRPKIPSDLYSIKIVKGIGCSSYVGQPTVAHFDHNVTLQDPGCIDDGRIMHELLHTLGFLHEQSRPDRDSYVRVITENISPGYELNFIKYGDDVVDTQSTPYDYGSVMHYERDAFSWNGLPTIEPLQANVVIGQRITISPIDILEVQMFYGCLSNTSTTSTSATATTTATTTVTTTSTPRIISTYSSAWTNSNPVYTHPYQSNGNYYYEAIQVSVPTAGYYTLSSNSSVGACVYTYINSFNQSNPSANLWTTVCRNGFSAYVQPNMVYVLVATTYAPGIIGQFSIIVTGPARTTFVNISPTTTTSTTTQTTTTLFTCSPPVNQPICPIRTNTSGRIVIVDPIGRILTGTPFVTFSTFFNADDQITTKGFIKNVTVQYRPARLPTTTGKIWIYGIVPVSGGFIVCSQYLVPSTQITTQAIQTYTIPNNIINVFNGTYVGVGILDASAAVASTYGSLALYTEGADQSTNVGTRSTLYFRPDLSRFGVKVTYTIVT